MSTAALLRASLDRKRLANLTALAALAGRIVTVIDDDHGAEIFVATRGPFTKQFDTLESFTAWLQESEADQ